MLFRPTYTIDTIYHLDSKQLQKMGIKAVFSDLDNTLLAWNRKETSAEMDALNKRLKKSGITLVVISNNTAERVGKVLDPYNISFIARSKKPLPVGINKALKHFDLQKKQAIMVGDQLITDMQAANLAGVPSVLVQPLIPSDKWNTRINRFFEKIIFFFLNLNKKVSFGDKLQ